MNKNFSLFLMVFLINCGGKDVFNMNQFEDLVGNWSGCITPSSPTNTTISSALLNFNFDPMGGFSGSYSFYPTNDCSGNPEVYADQIMGTYFIGNTSGQVIDAVEIQITINSCTLSGSFCDNNNWNTGNTIYEVFKIDSTGLQLGQCLRDLMCINIDGRPTALMGPLTKNSSF